MIWHESMTACPVCMALDGTRWSLEDFISNLNYEAPTFEKSHPNCVCEIEVTGPGLEPVTVYAF